MTIRGVLLGRKLNLTEYLSSLTPRCRRNSNDDADPDNKSSRAKSAEVNLSNVAYFMQSNREKEGMRCRDVVNVNDDSIYIYIIDDH